MENPSLRVSGHGGSTSRTFIVEDYPEDEYGQWATDEAPGEQGYIDDERSCFWTWDDNEQAWQSSQFKSREVQRRKGKRVKHSLVKNKLRTLNGGQKMVFGGPRVKEARKFLRKGKVKTTSLK